ncbi:hypothetical protein [Thiomicrorhabdus cannonii]|uniref:hypothetical protein n=1 Tax=Thiomicrorhabdus cannonii TaxID=2748011 RepID=UPI0015B89811|nr:hypothetical protein [Thiomicrorhabdus cannonii]
MDLPNVVHKFDLPRFEPMDLAVLLVAVEGQKRVDCEDMYKVRFLYQVNFLMQKQSDPLKGDQSPKQTEQAGRLTAIFFQSLPSNAFYQVNYDVNRRCLSVTSPHLDFILRQLIDLLRQATLN